MNFHEIFKCSHWITVVYIVYFYDKIPDIPIGLELAGRCWNQLPLRLAKYPECWWGCQHQGLCTDLKMKPAACSQLELRIGMLCCYGTGAGNALTNDNPAGKTVFIYVEHESQRSVDAARSQRVKCNTLKKRRRLQTNNNNYNGTNLIKWMVKWMCVSRE